jgi:hypothetical protein
LHKEGYNLGENWASGQGEADCGSHGILCENSVITGGAERMQDAIDTKIQRAIG